MIEDDHVVITVTSLIGDGDEQKLDVGDAEYSIHHRRLGRELRVAELQGWVNKYRNGVKGDPSTQAILVIIDGYSHEMDPVLHDAFPRFPHYLGQLVQSPRVRAPYRPSNSDHKDDVAFIINHYGGTGYSRYEDQLRHKDGPTHETWVAGYLGSIAKDPANDGRGGLGKHDERPLILLIFRKSQHRDWYDRYGHIVVGNYDYRDPVAPHRYNLFRRLGKQPLYAFLDLYYIFTSWEEPIARMQKNLVRATNHCVGRSRDAIQRVAEIEIGLSHLAFLRMTLQLHSTCHKRLRAVAESLVLQENGGCTCCHAKQTSPCSPGEERETFKRQRILWRIDDLEDRLTVASYSLEMMTTQFQNLEGVEFNISNAKSGQRLAWLSVLLFLLAPVSFVASIFGITTFEASVGWFALSGGIVFVLAVILCISLHAYFKVIEGGIKLPASAKDNVAFADMGFAKYRLHTRAEAQRMQRRRTPHGRGRHGNRDCRPEYESDSDESLDYGVVVEERV